MPLETLDMQNIASRHTRTVAYDNWMVSTNPSTDVIVATLRNPTAAVLNLSAQAAADLQGAVVEFTGGLNTGSVRTINSYNPANNEITLDSALGLAPATGDTFVILKSPIINAQVTENIGSVGGTPQTGADWTAIFQAMATDTSNIPNPPVREVFMNGVAATADTNLLTSDLIPASEGAYNIRVLVSAASAFSVTETPTQAPATGGSSSKTIGTLNSGSTLAAGAWYGFSMIIGPQASYNFQVGTSCSISLRVQYTQGQ